MRSWKVNWLFPSFHKLHLRASSHGGSPSPKVAVRLTSIRVISAVESMGVETCLVRDDLELLDDTQTGWSGWQYDSPPWNCLSTWWKSSQVVTVSPPPCPPTKNREVETYHFTRVPSMAWTPTWHHFLEVRGSTWPGLRVGLRIEQKARPNSQHKSRHFWHKIIKIWIEYYINQHEWTLVAQKSGLSLHVGTRWHEWDVGLGNWDPSEYALIQELKSI